MWIPRLFLHIGRALAAWTRAWFAPAPKAIVSPPPSPDDVYIARRTAALLASFAPERSQEAANANMCAAFYSRESLRTALVSGVQKNNASAIEKRWAARVLAESTPRGNLFMHYDAYRSAFVYYCDASLPYALTNAAAMRYVAVFACRDLFVDDLVLGAERRSPLAALEEAGEGLDLIRRIGALKTQSAPGLGPLPFVKLKKYGAVPATSAAPAAQPVMNRFVYLGRTRDMQLHQKSNSPDTMTETAAACWRAKAAEIKRDRALAAYHQYEVASGALQIAIVLASANVITGAVFLMWGALGLGLLGIVFSLIGLLAPTAVHLF